MSAAPRVSAVFLAVRVTPRSSRAEVTGVGEDGRLHIRVTAAPVDGAANEAVVRLLASVLDVPPSAIAIVGGVSSRRKRVRIEGIDVDAIRARWPGAAVSRYQVE